MSHIWAVYFGAKNYVRISKMADLSTIFFQYLEAYNYKLWASCGKFDCF